MSKKVDIAELVSVLQRIDRLLQEPDVDLTSTRYDSAEALRVDLFRYRTKVEAGDFGDEDRRQLALLFAPTGTIQDVSISSGWGEEFLVLAARADRALGYS